MIAYFLCDIIQNMEEERHGEGIREELQPGGD